MQGTHRITDSFNRKVEAERQINPETARTPSARREERLRPGFTHQLLDSVFSNIIKKVERMTVAFLALDRGPQPSSARVQHLQAACEKIRQAIVLFFLGVVGYAALAGPLFPQQSVVQTAGGLLMIVLPAMALRLQRVGLRPSPGDKLDATPTSTISLRKLLERMLERLPMAAFSPDKEFGRSATIGLAAVLLLFPLTRAIGLWFSGYPLPAGVSWAGVTGRFLLLLALYALFAWIWKASKLLAAVIKTEIKALDGEAGVQ